MKNINIINRRIWAIKRKDKEEIMKPKRFKSIKDIGEDEEFRKILENLKKTFANAGKDRVNLIKYLREKLKDITAAEETNEKLPKSILDSHIETAISYRGVKPLAAKYGYSSARHKRIKKAIKLFP